MIFVSGILTAISVYLVLSKSLIRIIMGTTLLTHAANLFLITMGGLKHGKAPIYEKGTQSYVDPIPHAESAGPGAANPTNTNEQPKQF